MRIGLILSTALLAAATPAMADVVATPGTSEGVTTDKLNGATVTSTSPILGGFTANDAFGSVTSSGPYQESQNGGHVIFADGSTPNFINFNTAASVFLQGVNIFVTSDGPTNADRQFGTINLFAGATANALTSLGAVTIPGSGGYTVRYTFAPTNFQFFRFEGTNVTNGARLLEIDGVAAVPEPAAWAMMIAGFGMVGGAMRVARRRKALAAA